ncbi:MAG: hypothetical protein C4584_00295 [Armatimonadetes bacterium]|nr:MAG: hypothetical protein C4584_00295 [Armatimonadota bacterium]
MKSSKFDRMTIRLRLLHKGFTVFLLLNLLFSSFYPFISASPAIIQGDVVSVEKVSAQELPTGCYACGWRRVADDEAWSGYSEYRDSSCETDAMGDWIEQEQVCTGCNEAKQILYNTCSGNTKDGMAGLQNFNCASFCPCDWETYDSSCTSCGKKTYYQSKSCDENAHNTYDEDDGSCRTNEMGNWTDLRRECTGCNEARQVQINNCTQNTRISMEGLEEPACSNLCTTCTPNCGDRGSRCASDKWSDGCGGDCWGEKQGDCSDSWQHCSGETYTSSNGCGSCTGTKDCSSGSGGGDSGGGGGGSGPVCTPSCGNTGGYCAGLNYQDSCGGNTCWGVQSPDCGDASNRCRGESFNSRNDCGGCTGTKDCGNPNACVPDCTSGQEFCVGKTYKDGCGGDCPGTANCTPVSDSGTGGVSVPAPTQPPDVPPEPTPVVSCDNLRQDAACSGECNQRSVLVYNPCDANYYETDTRFDSTCTEGCQISKPTPAQIAMSPPTPTPFPASFGFYGEDEEDGAVCYCVNLGSGDKWTGNGCAVQGKVEGSSCGSTGSTSCNWSEQKSCSRDKCEIAVVNYYKTCDSNAVKPASEVSDSSCRSGCTQYIGGEEEDYFAGCECVGDGSGVERWSGGGCSLQGKTPGDFCGSPMRNEEKELAQFYEAQQKEVEDILARISGKKSTVSLPGPYIPVNDTVTQNQVMTDYSNESELYAAYSGMGIGQGAGAVSPPVSTTFESFDLGRQIGGFLQGIGDSIVPSKQKQDEDKALLEAADFVNRHKDDKNFYKNYVTTTLAGDSVAGEEEAVKKLRGLIKAPDSMSDEKVKEVFVKGCKQSGVSCRGDDLLNMRVVVVDSVRRDVEKTFQKKEVKDMTMDEFERKIADDLKISGAVNSENYVRERLVLHGIPLDRIDGSTNTILSLAGMNNSPQGLFTRFQVSFGMGSKEKFRDVSTAFKKTEMVEAQETIDADYAGQNLTEEERVRSMFADTSARYAKYKDRARDVGIKGPIIPPIAPPAPGEVLGATGRAIGGAFDWVISAPGNYANSVQSQLAEGALTSQLELDKQRSQSLKALVEQAPKKKKLDVMRTALGEGFKDIDEETVKAEFAKVLEKGGVNVGGDLTGSFTLSLNDSLEFNPNPQEEVTGEEAAEQLGKGFFEMVDMATGGNVKWGQTQMEIVSETKNLEELRINSGIETKLLSDSRLRGITRGLAYEKLSPTMLLKEAELYQKLYGDSLSIGEDSNLQAYINLMQPLADRQRENNGEHLANLAMTVVGGGGIGVGAKTAAKTGAKTAAETAVQAETKSIVEGGAGGIWERIGGVVDDAGETFNTVLGRDDFVPAQISQPKVLSRTGKVAGLEVKLGKTTKEYAKDIAVRSVSDPIPVDEEGFRAYVNRYFREQGITDEDFIAQAKRDLLGERLQIKAGGGTAGTAAKKVAQDIIDDGSISSLDILERELLENGVSLRDGAYTTENFRYAMENLKRFDNSPELWADEAERTLALSYFSRDAGLRARVEGLANKRFKVVVKTRKTVQEVVNDRSIDSLGDLERELLENGVSLRDGAYTTDNFSEAMRNLRAKFADNTQLWTNQAEKDGALAAFTRDDGLRARVEELANKAFNVLKIKSKTAKEYAEDIARRSFTDPIPVDEEGFRAYVNRYFREQGITDEDFIAQAREALGRERIRFKNVVAGAGSGGTGVRTAIEIIGDDSVVTLQKLEDKFRASAATLKDGAYTVDDLSRGVRLLKKEYENNPSAWQSLDDVWKNKKLAEFGFTRDGGLRSKIKQVADKEFVVKVTGGRVVKSSAKDVVRYAEDISINPRFVSPGQGDIPKSKIVSYLEEKGVPRVEAGGLADEIMSQLVRDGRGVMSRFGTVGEGDEIIWEPAVGIWQKSSGAGATVVKKTGQEIVNDIAITTLDELEQAFIANRATLKDGGYTLENFLAAMDKLKRNKGDWGDPVKRREFLSHFSRDGKLRARVEELIDAELAAGQKGDGVAMSVASGDVLKAGKSADGVVVGLGGSLDAIESQVVDDILREFVPSPRLGEIIPDDFVIKTGMAKAGYPQLEIIKRFPKVREKLLSSAYVRLSEAQRGVLDDWLVNYLRQRKITSQQGLRDFLADEGYYPVSEIDAAVKRLEAKLAVAVNVTGKELEFMENTVVGRFKNTGKERSLSYLQQIKPSSIRDQLLSSGYPSDRIDDQLLTRIADRVLRDEKKKMDDFIDSILKLGDLDGDTVRSLANVRGFLDDRAEDVLDAYSKKKGLVPAVQVKRGGAVKVGDLTDEEYEVFTMSVKQKIQAQWREVFGREMTRGEIEVSRKLEGRMIGDGLSEDIIRQAMQEARLYELGKTSPAPSSQLKQITTRVRYSSAGGKDDDIAHVVDALIERKINTARLASRIEGLRTAAEDLRDYAIKNGADPASFNRISIRDMIDPEKMFILDENNMKRLCGEYAAGCFIIRDGVIMIRQDYVDRIYHTGAHEAYHMFDLQNRGFRQAELLQALGGITNVRKLEESVVEYLAQITSVMTKNSATYVAYSPHVRALVDEILPKIPQKKGVLGALGKKGSDAGADAVVIESALGTGNVKFIMKVGGGDFNKGAGILKGILDKLPDVTDHAAMDRIGVAITPQDIEKAIREARIEALLSPTHTYSLKHKDSQWTILGKVFAADKDTESQIIGADAESFELLVKRKLIKNLMLEYGEIDQETVARIMQMEIFSPQVSGDSSRGYDLVTGKGGVVEGSVDEGTYRVNVDSIPGLDITIPEIVDVGEGKIQVLVGVKSGSGQVKKVKQGEKSGGGLLDWFPNIFKVFAAEHEVDGPLVSVLVFDDRNGNGRMDSSEEPVSLAALNVELDNVYQEKMIELTAGWNLVTLNILPSKALTASVLGGEIAKQGGYSTTISTLENGVWKSYVTRGDKTYTGEDFPIEPGKAYFVKALKPSVLVIKGQEFAAPIELDLKDGWNAVGFPKLPREINAVGVIDVMQGKNFDADAIARWESGLWDTFVKKTGEKYGENFDIETIRGYILRVKKGGKATL